MVAVLPEPLATVRDAAEEDEVFAVDDVDVAAEEAAMEVVAGASSSVARVAAVDAVVGVAAAVVAGADVVTGAVSPAASVVVAEASP